jgi:hypothetical protein
MSPVSQVGLRRLLLIDACIVCVHVIWLRSCVVQATECAPHGWYADMQESIGPMAPWHQRLCGLFRPKGPCAAAVMRWETAGKRAHLGTADGDVDHAVEHDVVWRWSGVEALFLRRGTCARSRAEARL